MANRRHTAVARTDVNRNLVSSQMTGANVQSAWRAPDMSGVINNINDIMGDYVNAQKDAAFKRYDLEAGKMQMKELEDIRLATKNEDVPKIEKGFKDDLKMVFEQDSWGKQWLKERGDLFFAANSRDVMRAGIAKQHELYNLELGKTLNTWTDDIATSQADKAKVMFGDMMNYIDASTMLSPEEKKKYKDNVTADGLQKLISANPSVALDVLDDKKYKWSENGIDVDKYKRAALGSIKQADEKRLIAEINHNRQAASQLIQKSAKERLSLDEINKAVPESSKELRAFLYDINGYPTDGGKAKISEEEKALNEQQLYDDFASLLGSKDTKIEDWQKFENNVYKAMNNKAITKQAGLSMLDNFATPFMEKWQDNLEDAGNNHWFSKDFGYNGLNKWIKKNVIKNEVNEKDYKNNKAYFKKLQAGQARVRSELYRQYNDALMYLAKENKLNNVGEIKNLPDAEQDRIYGAAQDAVINNYNAQKFRDLANITPDKQPNKVLSGGDMVPNVNNADNAKQGTPVKQTGTVNVGKYSVEIMDE